MLGTIAIVVLSLDPKPQLPGAVAELSDLALHFAGYGCLGFSVMIGWPDRVRLILCALPLFGLALEFGQIPVPGRAFEWADALANALGALVGTAVGWVALRFKAA